MSSAYINIQSGTPGAAAANMEYITRESARDGEPVLHNAPAYVEEVGDQHTLEGWQAQRAQLKAWAEARQEEEIARHGNRKGEPRTHYRVVMSYEDEIPTEAAQEDVRGWLEEEFPESRAAAVVHQDTQRTHVHVWMSARLRTGKKVDISPQDFRSLTSEWSQIYERRMEQRRILDIDRETLEEKIQHTREAKAKMGRKVMNGTSPAMAELSVDFGDRTQPAGPEVYRERDRKHVGMDLVREVEEQMQARQEQRTEAKAEEQVRAAAVETEKVERAIERRARRVETKRTDSHEHHERNQKGAGGGKRTSSGSPGEVERRERRAGQGSPDGSGADGRESGKDLGKTAERGQIREEGGKGGGAGSETAAQGGQRGVSKGSQEQRPESQGERPERRDNTGKSSGGGKERGRGGGGGSGAGVRKGNNNDGGGEHSSDVPGGGSDQRDGSRSHSVDGPDGGGGAASSDGDGGRDDPSDGADVGDVGPDEVSPDKGLSEAQRRLLRAIRQAHYKEIKNSEAAREGLIERFMRLSDEEMEELAQEKERHIDDEKERDLLEWGHGERRRREEQRERIEASLSQEASAQWETVKEEVDAAAEGGDVEQRMGAAAEAWRSVASELEQGERKELLRATWPMRTARTIRERAQKQRGSQESGQDKSTDQGSSKDRGGQSWGGGRGR